MTRRLVKTMDLDDKKDNGMKKNTNGTLRYYKNELKNRQKGGGRLSITEKEKIDQIG